MHKMSEAITETVKSFHTNREIEWAARNRIGARSNEIVEAKGGREERRVHVGRSRWRFGCRLSFTANPFWGLAQSKPNTCITSVKLCLFSTCLFTDEAG